MDVKKFQLAMRPKKYLTHDFLVYQDPKMQAARSEMQAGGIVQREGFSRGAKPKFSLDTVRETIDQYNNQLVYKDRNVIAKELGFKNADGLTTYLTKNKIAFPELKKDKAKKIAEYILNNLDESADTYLGSPLKVIGKKYNLPGSYITTSLKNADEPILKEFAPFINKLSNPAFVKKWKGQDLLLSDVMDMHLSKVNLPRATTPSQDIMKTAARHYALTGPEKSKIQFFDIETNKPLTLDQATNQKSLYKDVYFKIKGNDAKFGIGISDNKNYVNLDLEGSQRPEFKEMYDIFNKKQDLMNRKVINPATGKEDTFRNVAGAMYADTYKNSYQSFPYDLDHLDLEKNPFSNVRLLPRRINQAAGLMKQHQAPKEYFNKIGYNVTKDVDQLFEDEMKLAQDVLGPKQRKLYKPYMIAKGVERADPQFSYTSGQIRALEKGEDVFAKKDKPKLKLESDFLKSSVAQVKTDIENNSNTMRALIESFSDDPACALPAKAEGGRIGFQKGSDLCYQQGLKKLDEARKNPGAAAKLKGKLGKAAKGFGKFLRFLELPFEVAIEGLLVGDAMLRGQSFERAVKGNTLLMRALMPGGYSTTADEQRIKEISENNPAVKTYFEAKQRADKYQELVNRVEQNEKIAAGLVAPEDVGLTTSNLEESKKELNDFIQNNFQNFDRDKEILNPEGYFAQQADQATRDFVSKEVYEGGYGKGQVAAREAQIEDPLADFVQPEQEFEKERLEESQEQVDQFGFIPTEQEFMQGLNKDAMKGFIKNRYPNMDEQQLNMLTDFAIQQQYQNIRNPFAVYDYSRNVQASPFAVGGRVGFSNGGGMRRRTFLKLIAGVGAALGALKSGIIKLSSPVAKKVLKDAPAGTPDWFAPLVDKIMREGVDAGETMKTVTGREIVKKLEVPAPGSDGAITDKYFLYENPDTGEIRVDIDAPGAGANDGEFSFYMRPDRVEGVNDDGTPMLNEGEFFVIEDRAENLPDFSNEVNLELVSNEFNLEDSVSNWHKVEEFATGKTNKKAEAELLKKKNRVESDPVEDVVNRRGEYDYSYAKDQDIDE